MNPHLITRREGIREILASATLLASGVYAVGIPPVISRRREAQPPAVPAASGGGGTWPSDPHLIFEWHAETADVTTGTPSGGSAGDTTGSAFGGAVISTSQAEDGTHSISIPTAEDYYTFDWSSTAKICNPTAGTLDFYLYIPSLTSEISVFDFRVDANNNIGLLIYSDGMLYAVSRQGGTASATRSLTGAIGSAAWYHVKLRWDHTAHSGQYIKSTADATTGESNNDISFGTDVLGTWAGTSGTVKFGDWDNDAGGFYMDNIRIYDNWQ